MKARSKYNSPIFAVLKKNGGIRLVKDFRALNAETHIDKYCMRDVRKCISEIGRGVKMVYTSCRKYNCSSTAYSLTGKGLNKLLNCILSKKVT